MIEKGFGVMRGLHSLEVARLMHNAALLIKENDKEHKYDIDPAECFFLGYNHDIGYQFTKGGKQHTVAGGKLLKKLNFKDWESIAYRGNESMPYPNVNLFLLDYFDMHVNYDAGHVSFNKRIKDAKDQYSKNSYRVQLLKSIKNKIIKSQYYNELDSLLKTIL